MDRLMTFPHSPPFYPTLHTYTKMKIKGKGTMASDTRIKKLNGLTNTLTNLLIKYKVHGKGWTALDRENHTLGPQDDETKRIS